MTSPTERPADPNEWFIQLLIDAGYTRREAEKLVAQDLADAAEEDGYDGP